VCIRRWAEENPRRGGLQDGKNGGDKSGRSHSEAGLSLCLLSPGDDLMN